MKNSWAAPNLYGLSGSGDLFEALHSGLKVDLIATPRSDLKTCGLSEDVLAVLQRNTNLYDYIPVVDDSADGSPHIVGLSS
jgi:hypothetical protein